MEHKYGNATNNGTMPMKYPPLDIIYGEIISDLSALISRHISHFSLGNYISTPMLLPLVFFCWFFAFV